MVITDITKTKKQRFSLFVDEEFFAALHMDVYAASGLTVGSIVTEEQLLSLLEQSQQKITRDRAYRLLSVRQYSKKKLKQKLSEYAPPEVLENTVQRLEDLGLIDDSQYANALAKDLFRLKGFSKNRISLELTRKGIHRDTIDSVLEQFDWEEDDQRLDEIIARRVRGSLQDPKERNRIFGYLVRMGYEYDAIHSAIRRYIQE